MKHLSFQYADTGLFSKLVLDYLKGAPQLRKLYAHRPNWEGIAESIKKREAFPTNRSVLAKVLQEQYTSVSNHAISAGQIEQLIHENSFTVCTAHQPNLFTGPIYVFYKIIHTIKLADELNHRFPDKRFIPVYYMGSEDADLDELGYTHTENQTLRWNTKQKGAVGRMVVDDALLELMKDWFETTRHQLNADEVFESLQTFFVKGKSIQQASFELIHHWFGDKGLLVLIPDHASLKSLATPIWKSELLEQSTQKSLKETQSWLASNYRVQASGREINLFFLESGIRARLIKDAGQFHAVDTDFKFSEEAMLACLHEHPETMSPNVLLRPLFQELILPNVAFVGGGGELAYWLSVKPIFDLHQIPYPVLLLRQSFVLFDKETSKKFEKLFIPIQNYFGEQAAFEYGIARLVSSSWPDLTQPKDDLKNSYQAIAEKVKAVDASLVNHVNALQNAAQQKIEALEKKLARAIKKRSEASIRQADKIRSVILPDGGFQERKIHGAEQYARFGKGLLDVLYNHVDTLGREGVVLFL
jgi:bacillithiol biosynthesis cysteine-adding enzyme BshC